MVAGVGAAGCVRGRAHDVGAAGRPHQARHLGQRRQAALPDDPLGRLGDRAEHAADPAGLVGDRAVGVGEVALLRVAVAVEHEQLVGRPGGAPAAHHLVEHRPDDVPDLGPHLPARGAEGPRVLALPSIGR